MNQDFTVQKNDAGLLKKGNICLKKNSCRGVHLKKKNSCTSSERKKNSCKLKILFTFLMVRPLLGSAHEKFVV